MLRKTIFAFWMIFSTTLSLASESEQSLAAVFDAIETVRITNDEHGGKRIYIPGYWQEFGGHASDRDTLLAEAKVILDELRTFELAYLKLELEDRLAANKLLYEIDDLVATSQGYGNALVKTKIAELLLKGAMQSLLRSDRKEDHQAVLSEMSVIKYHLPDRLSLFLISMEEFGANATQRPLNAVASSPGDFQDQLRRVLEKYVNEPGNQQAFQKLNEMYSDTSVAMNRFTDLLEINGGPMISSLAGSYYINWLRLTAYASHLISGRKASQVRSDEIAWYRNIMSGEPWSDDYVQYAAWPEASLENMRIGLEK